MFRSGIMMLALLAALLSAGPAAADLPPPPTELTIIQQGLPDVVAGGTVSDGTRTCSEPACTWSVPQECAEPDAVLGCLRWAPAVVGLQATLGQYGFLPRWTAPEGDQCEATDPPGTCTVFADGTAVVRYDDPTPPSGDVIVGGSPGASAFKMSGGIGDRESGIAEVRVGGSLFTYGGAPMTSTASPREVVFSLQPVLLNIDHVPFSVAVTVTNGDGDVAVLPGGVLGRDLEAPVVRVAPKRSRRFGPSNRHSWSLATHDSGPVRWSCSLTPVVGPVTNRPCAQGALELAGLAPGFYRLAIEAMDAAGNIGRARVTFLVFEPIADAVVRLRDVRSARGTQIGAVEVRRLGAGVEVRVTCRGGGCPRGDLRLRRRGSLATVVGLRGRALRQGAVLSLRITQDGLSGQVVRFTMRRGLGPRRTTVCLTEVGKVTRCD